MRGLTFELSRVRRTDDLPERAKINPPDLSGKAAGRSTSALERGVRPHRAPADKEY